MQVALVAGAGGIPVFILRMPAIFRAVGCVAWWGVASALGAMGWRRLRAALRHGRAKSEKQKMDKQKLYLLAMASPMRPRNQDRATKSLGAARTA